MSTRANIVIKECGRELIFYRHSDGYPEGTLPTLEKFVKWINDGKIRRSLMQASGWLIVIGNTEYGVNMNFEKDEPLNWKVGSYEITTGIHGDINYLYTIDLDKKIVEIEVKEI